MKITKKPKQVKVVYKKVEYEISEYTCPTCHTKFIGTGINRKITRFKCDCGQELAVT